MSRKHMNKWLLLTTILVLVVGACTPAVTEAPPTEAPATDEPMEKSTIVLAENPWDGSSLNTAVARILLEDELGYPVEVISLDEGATWPAIAAGDVHANLEQWPSGHGADIETYIDTGLIDNGGLLGVTGAIGWWIPTYLVEANPALATWEGFNDPDVAALFATAETGDKGQFLIGDPSYVTFDEAIITNLGLPFQTVVGGSEAALMTSIESAFANEDAILFYFWTPHSVHDAFDLTRVALPDVTPECEDAAVNAPDEYACDYPDDVLFKIISPDLADQAPDADALLRSFNYTSADQISMLAAVDGGLTIDEAAQAWVDANEAVWSAWIP